MRGVMWCEVGAYVGGVCARTLACGFCGVCVCVCVRVC